MVINMNIQIENMLEKHLNFLNLDEFDNFWNMNILKQELNSPSSFYIIAKFENDIVGFAGINFVLDEAHIANIVVKKNMRNLNIGSKLLETLINYAEKMATLITLEVNEQNYPAIHLYEKYGFENLGKRKKYYNNKFDAYIMTKYFN